MKKLIAVALGAILIGIPLTALSAERADNARQALEKGQPGNSNVSQRQKEIVNKRENARKKRDEKINVRNRNVKKSGNSSVNLFGNSK